VIKCMPEETDENITAECVLEKSHLSRIERGRTIEGGARGKS